jgi:uncharacterized protein (DUF1778 family)
METKTVNLRDLPVDLVQRAKACAALRGMTLKDFVVQAISVAVEKDVPAIRGSMSAFAVQERRNRNRKE